MSSEEPPKRLKYIIKIVHNSSKLFVKGDKAFVYEIYNDFKLTIKDSIDNPIELNEEDYDNIFLTLIRKFDKLGLSEYTYYILLSYYFLVLKYGEEEVDKKEFNQHYRVCFNVTNRKSSYSTEIANAKKRSKIIKELNEKILLTTHGKEQLNELDEIIHVRNEFYEIKNKLVK